ncbi:hypothetical protein TTHERM_000225937 (macronuclear) [Tetrahymena thermophila SB210]|uniref:AMP-binding enzyme family protein n=1 Tax=Tetrahymena thermophila (strain SB210) TaxID=312017 RepID=W7XIK4_TETTS|nr:hypothetical protein TTHERM_000225937 [Tetrahymena thermophila SB210]EWS74726.1 hypothetical protein TTHERM_000225937 [Tetrahymena thermophila SB210]|eukprot:XP_012652727.1 hypothetical protein TTHERM_000225937 [Tetrahymena thermophila SB210]
MQNNQIVNLNNQTQQNEITLNEQDEEKLNKNYDEQHKKNIFIPSLIPKSSRKLFQQEQLCDSQNTCQDQVLEELQTQIQKPDDFLESLRINQDKIINKQINLDKQPDYQIRLNLNKSNQNEKNYTQSVIRNIQQQQQQQQQQQFQLFTKDSSSKFANGVSIPHKHLNKQNKTSQSNQLKTQESETKNIKKQNEKVNKIFSNLNDKQVHLKLEKMLFQFKLCKKKEFLQSKGLNQQIISEIEQRIDESLDYYAFYKEILLIKKAIMMILNKQQLAALQVIGIDIEKKSKNQENSKMNYLSEEKTENHFKEQYEILQSKELQLQYINDFLKKCEQNRQNLDNIDKRILSSLLIYQQN